MPITTVAKGDRTLSPRLVPGFLEAMAAATRMIDRFRDTLAADLSYSRHSFVSAALQTRRMTCGRTKA